MKIMSEEVVRKTPKKALAICYISIFSIIGVLIGGLIWQFNIEQNSDYTKTDIKIAFIHSNDGFNEILFNKLNLDDGVALTPIKEQDIGAGTLDTYDIVAISNVDLSDTTRSFIAQYITASEDNSIIFFIDAKTDGSDLKYLNITKSDTLTSFQGDNEVGYGICRETGKHPSLTSKIPWNNMPEVKNYTLLTSSDFNTTDATSSSNILQDYADDTGNSFLFKKKLINGGKILIFTIWFDAELNVKEITESFPYIGYFFYSCYMFLEDNNIPSYLSWPYSPVPHFMDVLGIGLLFGTLAIASFLVFIYAYKYSQKHPLENVEALETEEEKLAKEKVQQQIDALLEEEQEYKEKTIEEIKQEYDDDSTFEEMEKNLPEYLQGWNAVGIHKQIGGFWSVFPVLIFLILPAAAVFLWLLPSVIFPSPSGQGFGKIVVDLFNILFIFFDFGTSTWMMRKFAAHRISEPRKAIASAQCFLWFQVLTGAIQIILIGFLGAIGFPATIYAHLTYVFIWYSLFQWLGFYLVFIFMINSLQRTDVAGIGLAALAPVLLLVQMGLVPLFIQIGAANPSIGIALGGAIGSAFSNFVTNLGMFLVSVWLFRKAFGYSGKSVFRVDFDGDMFKDMMKFGLKYTPGQLFVPLVWMIQVVLLSVYLDNYNNWLGYWNLANTVVMVSLLIAGFALTLIPVLSEAYENKKKNLFNYNIASGFKWTSNFNFWMTSTILAVMSPLILAITPVEFHSAVALLPLLILFQFMANYAAIIDVIFNSMDRPSYVTLSLGLEQALRLGLMILFIPLMASDPTIGIFSIMFAYVPAVIIRDFIGFFLIKKQLKSGFILNLLKTYIAPGIAGVCFFFVMTLIVFITGGGLIGAAIAVLFAFTFGPFIFFFFSGLFGGWSRNGLEEFKRSVGVMSFVGKYANGLYRCCRAGAKLSPISEKGNIDLYHKARIEAWELTLEKKKLQNL